MQVLGKAIGLAHAVPGHPHLLVQIHLASVRLVGDTDHVVAVGEQLGIFGELVDGGQEHTATVTALEQFAQLGPALHADHGLIADIGLGVGELLAELVVQIGAVGDQYNGRAFQLQTLHQQAGQEQHGVTLAAASGPEVGTALAVPQRFTMGQNVLVQLRGRIELGVAADDFLFLLGHIRKVDKVPQYLP